MNSVTPPDGPVCAPLPDWTPADLAEAAASAPAAAGPVAVLEGVDPGGERYALVAWGEGPRAASVEEAASLASGHPPGPAVPPMLGAVVGSLDWDGSARFWLPASAALFLFDRGQFWRRGQLPAVDGRRQTGGGGPTGRRPVSLLWDRPGYCAAVQEARRRMAAGELQKVILSVPMELACHHPPLSLYRSLTAGAHTGLRFLLDCGDGAGALLGISPEPLVALSGRQVRMRLLAGTRRLVPGAEQELGASAKDRLEHSVAVEQARQDLLAVCRPESVAVTAFMEVERHPGLVHLASSLTGELRDEAGPADLVAACFPAGTVGGIPRAAARALIEALEPLPRDWYAGSVGMVLPGGDLDLWLTIRSLHCRDGIVRLRTGAGLVRESDPEAEWRECLNKAAYTLTILGGELRGD